MSESELSPEQFPNYHFFMAVMYLAQLEKDTLENDAFDIYFERLRGWVLFLAAE